MGLFDKIKKAVGGSSPAPAAKPQGGNKSGGQGQGGNRQGGNRQGQGGQGQGSGSGGNRNRSRGSRGGRGRGGSGQGGQGGQGGNRQGGNRQGQGGGNQQTQEQQGQNAQNGQGQSSNARRRRRGGRGRGGSGSGQGSSSSGTRTVTRSDAAELKEKQGQGGEQKSSNRNRNRSRGGRSGGSGGGNNRRRERTRRGSSSSGSHRRVLDANERPKDPVKKQILINALDPNEIRVAIREQQQVVEVYVERKGKRSLAGNIYKGRVQNVLPGMEACFVDVGLERNGFLYVDEITPAAADSDQIMKVGMVTEVEATPEGAMEAAASEHDESIEMADAMAEEDAEQAAEASAEGADTADGDDAKKDGGAKGRGRSRIRNKKKIHELLKPGQEILVQVVKDPMGTKGSRLTTQYSLAGRYLVYVPDGEGLGVSRRLEDAERSRLREIVKQFELPWGGGLIVRTAAEGARDEDIAKDLDLLLRLHEQLMEKAGDARAPKLLYNEADLSLRIIRDLFNGEVEEVLVDDERQYQRITNYLKRTSPELAERVRMHDGQRPLFESYGVEDAIKSTLSKRADLPSGGYLILDKTEAFHVIDVNSGRNVGKASLEETITKTNMEAAVEVVRQLRLRDLGGIIVVDFIDMNLMKNRDAVLEHFRTELSKDRTKTYLVEISPLGLVEMTRQNVSEGVREILTSTCKTCEGRGVQISADTHAIEVERALVDLAAGLGDDIEAVAVDAQPDVAKALAGNQGKQAELDSRAGKHIRVLADPDLTPNTFALRATGTVAQVDATPEPLLRGGKHKVMIDQVDPLCADDGIATIDGIMVTVIGAGSSVGEEKTIVIAACSGTRAFATLVKPARRRRRRGGRGRRKAAVGVGAAGASDELDADAEDSAAGDDHDAESGDAADDEFEEFEDEIVDDEPVAAIEDEADERTEIPERLIMIDDEEDEHLDDDEDEDDAEGDDEGDDDADGDDDGSDDDSGSDSGSDGSHGDEVGDADDSDDDSGEDEDSHLDPLSAASGDDDGDLVHARRVEHVSDRDEPSIDADGADDLLTERGITAIKPAPSAASNGSAQQSGAGSVGPDGQPRKRRRRGSRGGRNRNRSGAPRANAGGGSGGSGDSGSSSSSES